MTFGPYHARVVDWHDGDTCHLVIDLGFGVVLSPYDLDGHPALSCRVYGIDAPELSTEAGMAALHAASQFCPSETRVTVTSHGWDKYGGRFDGEIELPSGLSFAEVMVKSGHAVRLEGKR